MVVKQYQRCLLSQNMLRMSMSPSVSHGIESIKISGEVAQASFREKREGAHFAPADYLILNVKTGGK